MLWGLGEILSRFPVRYFAWSSILFRSKRLGLDLWWLKIGKISFGYSVSRGRGWVTVLRRCVCVLAIERSLKYLPLLINILITSIFFIVTSVWTRFNFDFLSTLWFFLWFSIFFVIISIFFGMIAIAMSRPLAILRVFVAFLFLLVCFPPWSSWIWSIISFSWFKFVKWISFLIKRR